MSLNRELVVFYIRYKLSQRDFPLDHIRLSDTDWTDAGAVSDARLNGTANGSSPSPPLDSPLHEHTDTPSPPSRSLPPPSPHVPQQRSAASSVLAAAATPPAVDLEAVKEALRDSANEFELRFSRAFSDLHRQLHITPATAYRSFESVMDEVFRDGVNWGRVVGLFAFGGALCVECVEKEMSPLVTRIVDWMTVYLDHHIQDWITAQGGWARFAEIYGQDAAAESRRSQESLKRWLWAGATLVTGVVVGSLLAHRRL